MGSPCIGGQGAALAQTPAGVGSGEALCGLQFGLLREQQQINHVEQKYILVGLNHQNINEAKNTWCALMQYQ